VSTSVILVYKKIGLWFVVTFPPKITASSHVVGVVCTESTPAGQMVLHHLVGPSVWSS